MNLNQETPIHEWNYGECGVDKCGFMWSRTEDGAIGEHPSLKIHCNMSEDELTDQIVAVKNPKLKLLFVWSEI